MKRPRSVYLLVGFWSLLLAVIVALIVQGRTYPFFLSPWASLPRWKDALYLICVGAIPATVMAGVWSGKSWGRNLSLLVIILVILLMGRFLLGVFNIHSAEEFIGWTRYLIFNLIGYFLFFMTGFYLTLRPEVGKFCGIYPNREQTKT